MSEAIQSPRSLTSTAMRGAVIAVVAAVIIRGGGLIAQLVTGRLIDKATFGSYAVALGITTIGTALGTSIRPLLISQLASGHDVTGIWRLSLWTLAGLGVGVLVGANQIASWFGQPDVAPVIRVLSLAGASVVLTSHGYSRLGAELRFKESSRLLTISSMSRHAGVIILAVMGFGVMALAVPIYFETVASLFLLSRLGLRPPSIFGSVAGSWTTYRRRLIWIALGAAAVAANLSGDYLAISPLETAVIIGVYFFGFQLTAALTQPVTMVATNVLVPSFARVSDPVQAGVKFLEASRILLALSGLGFGLLSAVSPALISFAWSNKWDEAVPVVIALSIGMPFRMLSPLSNAFFQGNDDFGTPTVLTTIQGILAIAGAVIGAKIGGALAIAVGAGIGLSLFGIVAMIAIVVRGFSTKVPAALSLIVGSAPPAAGFLLMLTIVEPTNPSLVSALVRVALFIAGFATVSGLVLRGDIQRLYRNLRP